MATAGRVQCEDQFLCSICLDLFTDPVTIPCGHNFCKNCITEHFNVNVPQKCPMCNEVFDTRLELKINNFISRMVAHFQHQAQHKPNISSSDQQGDVPCDVCTAPKLKALKSCMVCLSSYCQTHLEPHLTVSELKSHQLIQPVENLEDRMCWKHNKPLELFCKTDHTCICHDCTYSDHKSHDVFLLKVEVEEPRTVAEIQKMIQERKLRIQSIKHLVKVSREAADRETAEAVEVFTALMESVQRSLDQLTEEIQQKQRTTKKQAEDFIKELEEEISELKKRRTEVEQFSDSEDHLQSVQRFTSVKAAPPMKTWTKVSIRPPSYAGTVVRAVSQLEDKLRENIKKVVEAELRRVQQHEVDVTLDPNTASPYLVVSNDEKQVNCYDILLNIQDNPKRFSICCNILGKQRFSSGKFYFEVQVKGKTKWDLGVARESINRKAQVTLSPLNGYWTIWLRNRNEYKARTDPPILLSLKSQPAKVGVFVDYEEGLVSFYDVDSSALIYSFTGCCFNDKLLPFFSPCRIDGGDNCDPMIITPVRHTE